MTTHFIQALVDLELMLAEVAARSEKAVHLAIGAVEMNNIDAARGVVFNDSFIDQAEIRIEEECLKILALYQPLAGDLRRVITILKVNNELERVGDLAVNIAERVEDMSFYQERMVEKFDFRDMVNLACSMLKKVLDALSSHDRAAAAAVIAEDDQVDAIHRDNYGKVRDLIIAHPDFSSYYMDCLTISRCLERIADIATNIAEDVIYLESGQIVRHAHEGENHGQ